MSHFPHTITYSVNKSYQYVFSNSVTKQNSRNGAGTSPPPEKELKYSETLACLYTGENRNNMRKKGYEQQCRYDKDWLHSYRHRHRHPPSKLKEKIEFWEDVNINL